MGSLSDSAALVVGSRIDDVVDNMMTESLQEGFLRIYPHITSDTASDLALLTLAVLQQTAIQSETDDEDSDVDDEEERIIDVGDENDEFEEDPSLKAVGEWDELSSTELFEHESISTGSVATAEKEELYSLLESIHADLALTEDDVATHLAEINELIDYSVLKVKEYCDLIAASGSIDSI